MYVRMLRHVVDEIHGNVIVYTCTHAQTMLKHTVDVINQLMYTTILFTVYYYMFTRVLGSYTARGINTMLFVMSVAAGPGPLLDPLSAPAALTTPPPLQAQ